MSPKERIKAAMDMNPVDKIPFMCQMSIGHMLVQLGVSPLEFWLDMNVYAEGLVKLREEYGFDGILISLYGHDPDWKDKLLYVEKKDDYEIATFNNGDKLYCPFNDLPYYKFADQPEPLNLELISENKLTDRLSYFPVSQNLPFFIHPKHRFDVIIKLVEERGSQYSIHGEITSPFDYYLDLFGHQEALMGLIDFPEKVKLVLAHYTKLIKEFADEMYSTGVDAVKISSPSTLTIKSEFILFAAAEYLDNKSSSSPRNTSIFFLCNKLTKESSLFSIVVHTIIFLDFFDFFNLSINSSIIGLLSMTKIALFGKRVLLNLTGIKISQFISNHYTIII